MIEASLLSSPGIVKTILLPVAAIAAMLAAPGVAWSQEPAAAQPTAAQAAEAGQEPAAEEEKPVDMDEMLDLSLPDNMDIKVFVEYVGQKLRLKFIYDSTLGGAVSIKPNQKIRVGELYNLLEDALNVTRFSMIHLPESDWILIVPTSKAPQWARLLPPNMPGVKIRGETIVTETVRLQFVDPKDVQIVLTPFLSDNGQVIPLPDHGMVQIVETKKRMEQLRPLIKLIDVQQARIEVRIIELEFTRAPDMANKLNNILAARVKQKTRTVPVRTTVGTGTRITWQRVTAQEEQPPFIDVDLRTNRLILIGTPEELDKLGDILAIYDVPMILFQVVKQYHLKYLVASDAMRAIQELGVGGMQFTTTPLRRPAPTTRAARTAAARARTASTREVGGTGALPKMTTLEDINTLLVSATEEEHEAIRKFLDDIDRKPPDEGKIRIYPLVHRSVVTDEDSNQPGVGDMLKEVMEAGAIDPRTKAPIPGTEGAPVIVAFEPTNSIMVKATPTQHDEIAKLIEDLDRRLPQVLLECTLIEVTKRNDSDIGFEMEMFEILGNIDHNDRAFASTQLGFSARDPATELRILPGSFGMGGNFAWIEDSVVLSLMRMIETRGDTRLLSKPRLLVNDNQEGSIQAIDEEPVTELTALTAATSTVSFKEYVQAGTTLTIKPTISEGDFLTLDITVSVESFTGDAPGANVPPPRSSREMTTRITVPDQRTIIIGGLHGKRKIDTVTQIPFIGDIPLLGELFKRRQKLDVNTTIYLFVKASIIRDVTFQDLHDETKEARDLLPEDLKELDSNLTDEAAREEAKKLNEVLRRRAMEKELKQGGQVNLAPQRIQYTPQQVPDDEKPPVPPARMPKPEPPPVQMPKPEPPPAEPVQSEPPKQQEQEKEKEKETTKPAPYRPAPIIVPMP